jgi:N-acetyl-gamma-glutamylphosphate reductase
VAVPELFGGDLPGTELVACAGCYATAVQLRPPALRSPGRRRRVVVAALSGTTGAGHDLALSFSEMAGACAYRMDPTSTPRDRARPAHSRVRCG